jgi:uncharacterized protein (DUF58 family)
MATVANAQAATASPAAALAPNPAPTAGRSVRARFRAWWQARLPVTDTWLLGQNNIYILPTKAGLTFGLTLVVMLLASINYQLNLGYALTFALTGAGLVSMHVTHGNLRRLTLHLRPVGSCFAGAAAQLEVVLSNPSHDRHGLMLMFEDRTLFGKASAWCDAGAGAQVKAMLSFVPPSRGWHSVPTLVVATVFPFGLFRAWTVWRPAAKVLAWPKPEDPAPGLPTGSSNASDERALRQGQGSELDGVRPWRRGDSLRQVAWKKVARSGELVSRETAGTASRELWLDWSETPGTDVEGRLSRLAAWVVLAEREGVDCGLRLPRQNVPLGHGDAHRRDALDALARFT